MRDNVFAAYRSVVSEELGLQSFDTLKHIEKDVNNKNEKSW